jgi:hypothetical protein
VLQTQATEAAPVRALRIGLPYTTLEFERLMSLFIKGAEEEGKARYRSAVPAEERYLPAVVPGGITDSTRASYRHVNPAYPVPDEMRRPVLDAMEEPVPEEYRTAQERYFEQLSESHE